MGRCWDVVPEGKFDAIEPFIGEGDTSCEAKRRFVGQTHLYQVRRVVECSVEKLCEQVFDGCTNLSIDTCGVRPIHEWVVDVDTEGRNAVVGDELAGDLDDHNRQDRIDGQVFLSADVGGGQDRQQGFEHVDFDDGPSGSPTGGGRRLQASTDSWTGC